MVVVMTKRGSIGVRLLLESLLLACSFTVVVEHVAGLPVVDKGVFVITGVKTCRDGYGYCILGTDCTVDKEFINDDRNGHCEGLKKAFTPRAFFVCCQSLENSTIVTPPPPTTTSTSTLPPPPSIEEEDDETDNESAASVSSNSASNENNSSPESGEIIFGNTTTTTTTQPTIHEEFHTEISISEDFHVVVNGETISSSNGGGGMSVATTTTTTSTTTTSPPQPARQPVQVITTTTPQPRPQADFTHETCGYKATFYSAGAAAAAAGSSNGHHQGPRIDGSRLAAQQTSLVCWTAAIVRSPSSLTLQDPGSFICTGALISEEFLLTTATCVSRLFAQDLSLFKVALGSRHLVHPMNGPTPDATYKDIVQLIVHEDYNIQGLFKRVNDVALVRLSPSPSTVRTDEHLAQNPKNASPYCTVCLPDGMEDHSGQDCIVTGFSHPTGSASSASSSSATIDEILGGGNNGNNHHGGGGVPSAHDTDGILHEAEQRIEYANNCEVQLSNFTVAQNTLLRNDLNIEESKLVCASGKFNAEACFSPRDAGSPLACPSAASPEQYKLVGVFSSGFHCGTSSSPVLYTDVSKFVGWIRENMRKSINRDRDSSSDSSRSHYGGVGR